MPHINLSHMQGSTGEIPRLPHSGLTAGGIRRLGHWAGCRRSSWQRPAVKSDHGD